MRPFTDRSGRRWDVVVGRESWGALLALFVPGDGGMPVRQSVLRASAYAEAMEELDALDDVALQNLLDRSVEKEA